MANLTKKQDENRKYILVDFIYPTPETRNLFAAGFMVWMNMIKKRRFDDINKILQILQIMIFMLQLKMPNISLLRY
jgi:hypothetical protein|tara:strand:+ start:243 stop:470 length:228 start_codon:yes stop_codon:yes gene_type:complete